MEATHSSQHLISASEALDLMAGDANSFAWLDVRSEGEFEKTRFQPWVNIPILNDERRHLVGLTYKNEGQERAIELGHELVAPDKDKTIGEWRNRTLESEKKTAIVSCWRGGLRSKIATEWIVQSGVNAKRVEGGYKAIRRVLLDRFDAIPQLVVLTGYTGSGKTTLIHELAERSIDLEGLAKHRGSSFGRHIQDKQPDQTSFENHLCLELYKKSETTRLLVEDESRTIGSVTIPDAFFKKMRDNTVVLLNEDISTRAKNILQEYVTSPTENGHSRESVQEHLIQATSRLKSRLGEDAVKKISGLIEKGFYTGDSAFHVEWIETLLRDYYDPLYKKSLSKSNREIAFSGNRSEVKSYLENLLY